MLNSMTTSHKDKPLDKENKESTPVVSHERKSSLPTADYSPEQLTLLLTLDGFEQEPKLLLPKDQCEQRYEYYFHPPTKVHNKIFLADSLAYVYAKQGDISNRRVCFLLIVNSKLSALIINFDGPNKSLAGTLYQSFASLLASGATTQQALLQDDKLCRTQPLQNLYSQRTVTLYGDTSPTLLQLLRVPIEQAYAGETKLSGHTVQQQYYHLTLLETIRARLRHNQNTTFSVRTATSHALTCCRTHFLKRLDNLKETNLPLHADLTKVLHLTLKARELERFRQHKYGPQHSEHEDKADYAALCLRQSENETVKAQLFCKPITDLDQMIAALFNFSVLTRLLMTSTPEQLLQELKQDYALQKQQLETWEKNLDQHIRLLQPSCCARFTQQSKLVLQFAYQYSWVAMGAKIVPWLTQWPCQWLTTTRAGKAVAHFTHQHGPKVASKALKKYGEKYSEEYLRGLAEKISLSHIMQGLGAGLGLTLHLYGGGYFLLRMLVIAKATLLWSKHQQRRHQDENLFWGIPDENLPSFLRINSFALTGIECLHTQNILPFIVAIGGSASNWLSTTIACNWRSNLQTTPTTRYQPNRIYTLFLIALGGQFLGSFILARGFYSLSSIQQRMEDCYYTKGVWDSQAAQSTGQLTIGECAKFSRRYDLWFSTDTNPIEISQLDAQGRRTDYSCLIFKKPIITENGFDFSGVICRDAEGSSPPSAESSFLALPGPR